MTTSREAEARTAGRGLLSISGAKAYFIVASYAMHVALPRLLEKETYGLYSKVTDTVSIFNNVLIASTVLTVSKFVSEGDAQGPLRSAATLRQGLLLQVGIGVVLSGAVIALAPVIAIHAFKDGSVTPLLRLAAVIMLAYAIYATFVGSLNGRRLFARQAALDATMATLRVGGVLGGAAIGLGAAGAIGGFAGAAVLITLLSAVVVGLGRPGETKPWRTWLAFMAPLWLYQLSLNAVLLIDSFMLSSAVTSLGLDAGLDATAAAAVGNQYVADYSAARKFALVPYQLMLSMTFIVFPMISRATSSGDEEGARELLRSALRFSLLVLVAVAAPIAGAADGVMRIAYTEEYLTGSGALQVLVIGAACFALFVITATALSGAGRPTTAAIIAGIGLVTVLVGNYVLVRLVGIGEHTVVAAASATSAGMFLSLAVSGVLVYQRFKAFLSPATVVRTAIAGGIAFATSYFVPHDSRMSALAALVLGGLAFVAALVVLREVTTKDLAQVRRILRR